MRKIIVSNMISLDGFIAGPNGELDWHLADEEFEKRAADMLNTVDTILFGRVTYEGMASYWPTAVTSPTGTLYTEGTKIRVPTQASKIHTEIAHKMNTLSKIVFSRTLEKVDWNNSKLLKGINKQEIMEMKQQPGKDMVILGGGDILSTFMELDLIDEYRIFVNPVVLGGGKPMFKDLGKRYKLKLVETKIFGSGLVGLYYRPEK